jgi:uncharacterized repeat protein (TIGR01451 family)
MKRLNSTTQIIIAVLLAGCTLAALSILTGTRLDPYPAMAGNGSDFSFTPAPPVAFGLTHPLIGAADDMYYDLEILKTTDLVSATSGTAITYTVIITNNGPAPAQYFYFYDNAPVQLQHISYTFSANATALSNNASDPADTQWLITNQLPANNTIVITVTGELTAAKDSLVSNSAIVTPFITTADGTPENNYSTAQVTVIGYSLYEEYFLPYISKQPTPTPLPIQFTDNFNDDDSGWYEGSFQDGDCSAEYKDSKYRTNVDPDEGCFFPAPGEAEFRYGKAETTARRNGGNDKFQYGIYINGQGGDYYYMFRVDFDREDCSWNILRRDSIKKSGSCDSESNGYREDNKLAVQRTGNLITVYINGDLLGSYTDSSPLPGEGTGFYVFADDDEEVTVVFDNFIVYSQ